MATTENPLAIGVFSDRSLAEHAVDELRHAGFRDDEIHVWGQGASTGSFLDTLINKFSGHETENGNISHSLMEMGVPQEDADYYQHEVESGHTVVAVRSYGHQQEANNILYRYGAYDASTSLARDIQTIPLREEVLQAHTQPVEVGEVYIRKEVVTEEKTITVLVQREEVIIERRPVSSEAPASGQPLGKLVEIPEGETLRIPIREEQIFIEKRPIVTEELIVGKRKIQETRHITDTVLREEPHIQREGDVVVHGSDVEDVSSKSE